jgi:hypothetical protein
VLAGEAQQLTVEADPFDSQRSRLALVQQGGNLPLNEDLVAGGSMAGLLGFQNDALQAARNGIGQIATALALRVNEQQALGLDLSNPPGAGVPVFAVGAARVLPASTNARDGAGQFLSGVTIDRVDANFLQASSYLLKADPANAGQYLIERESDGFTRSVADGDVVDGFRVTFTPAPPGAVRPVPPRAGGRRRHRHEARARPGAGHCRRQPADRHHRPQQHRQRHGRQRLRRRRRHLQRRRLPGRSAVRPRQPRRQRELHADHADRRLQRRVEGWRAARQRTNSASRWASSCD